MMYQLPIGARDLLPVDVVQQQWIEQQLADMFHRWSYQRIITPTLERLDTLTAGGAVRPETVIQVWDAEDGVLGLRPELTASIARAVVTRMAEVLYPQRLYYIANIFRQQPPTQASSQHEFYQAGVELLGAEGVLADAEVLQLLAECLATIGLERWHLILGDAGLTQSLLLTVPPSLRSRVRQAIAQLDRVTLEALPLEADIRQRALQLMDLRGNPADIFQEISRWSLDDTQVAAVHHLKSVIDLLTGHASITLDLSLIQTFDYYTGLVFEVVSEAEGGQRVLGQGGRYDQLLSLYHPQGKTVPGIGFSLNVQDIQQVLLSQGKLKQQMPLAQWLVVAVDAPAEGAAFAHAQQLRTQAAAEVRVELNLTERSPEAARQYAQYRQIPAIAWVSRSGSVTIEAIDLLPSTAH